jgi:hypothetical protein
MYPRDPKAEKGEPSELDKLQFDYAWKWFNFHAEQRTKMFNFMLIGLGVLATGAGTAIEHKSLAVTRIVSCRGVVLALAFWRMDRRNRELYDYSGEILLQLEEKVIFKKTKQFIPRNEETPVPYGIYRRVKPVETASEKSSGKLEKWFLGARAGKHRYLMPLISLAFVVFFALVFIFARWLQDEARNDNPVQIYLTCGIQGYCPVPPDKPYTFPQATSLVRSEKFSDFQKGSAVLDCDRSDVAGKINGLFEAIQSGKNKGLRSIVFLIGSTDRDPLSKDLGRQFESNTGLASSRVSAVEHCLQAKLAPENWPANAAPEIARFVFGPAYVPRIRDSQGVEKSLMAADRSVSVLVLGFPVEEPPTPH